MKKKIIITAISALPLISLASTEVTFLGGSNSNTVFKSNVSPYNSYSEIEEDGYINAGLGATAQVEFKNAEGIVDRFKYINSQLTTTANTDPANIEPADVQRLQDSLNSFATDYQYVNMSQISKLDSVINFKINAIDAGVSIGAKREIGSKIGFIKGADFENIQTTDPTDPAFKDKLAIFTKNVILDEYFVSLGKSLKIDGAEGRVVYGAKLKYMSLLANKKARDIQDYLNPGSTSSLSDELISDAGLLTSGTGSSAIDLDFGVKYETKNYMGGVTVKHALTPTFEYNDYTDATSIFKDAVVEKIEFKPLVRLEGRWSDSDMNWQLSGYYDVNETVNINGEPESWMGASASYSSSYKDTGWLKYIVPDLRVGYSKNKVGSQMSYYSVGATLGFVNLDLRTSTLDFNDFINNQSDTGLSGSLSVELDF